MSSMNQLKQYRIKRHVYRYVRNNQPVPGIQKDDYKELKQFKWKKQATRQSRRYAENPRDTAVFQG